MKKNDLYYYQALDSLLNIIPDKYDPVILLNTITLFMARKKVEKFISKKEFTKAYLEAEKIADKACAEINLSLMVSHQTVLDQLDLLYRSNGGLIN